MTAIKDHPDAELALDAAAALSNAYEARHGYTEDDNVADGIAALYQLLGNMILGDGSAHAGPTAEDIKKLVAEHF